MVGTLAVEGTVWHRADKGESAGRKSGNDCFPYVHWDPSRIAGDCLGVMILSQFQPAISEKIGVFYRIDLNQLSTEVKRCFG